MEAYEIQVSPEGELSFIYDDLLVDLLEEGSSSVLRVSTVEPGEGGWRADLAPVGGPVLGPFKLRSDALAAEVAWLKKNLF